ADMDILDRIKIQGQLDGKFSGGSIMHVNVENNVPIENMVELIKLCAKRGVRYFALNYNIQVCENEHITTGKKDTCSVCGAKITDNYTRIVGFLVNTKLFNKTRKEVDYPNRKFYKETQL
ncbi:MAG: anaerobic ribonucleoside-triphosphate reductase, partial [Candidatus Pacebacteria bacterium]|nr:anaerobic ribonucleoside-triphosphate reductase [Candidatus Paceibacterota bacterium]